MRSGYDWVSPGLGAFIDLMRLPGVPPEKRGMVQGALIAADADRTRGLNAKARIIADAFHVDFAIVRRLVT